MHPLSISSSPLGEEKKNSFPLYTPLLPPPSPAHTHCHTTRHLPPHLLSAAPPLSSPLTSFMPFTLQRRRRRKQGWEEDTTAGAASCPLGEGGDALSPHYILSPLIALLCLAIFLYGCLEDMPATPLFAFTSACTLTSLSHHSRMEEGGKGTGRKGRRRRRRAAGLFLFAHLIFMPVLPAWEKKEKKEEAASSSLLLHTCLCLCLCLPTSSALPLGEGRRRKKEGQGLGRHTSLPPHHASGR